MTNLFFAPVQGSPDCVYGIAQATKLGGCAQLLLLDARSSSGTSCPLDGKLFFLELNDSLGDIELCQMLTLHILVGSNPTGMALEAFDVNTENIEQLVGWQQVPRWQTLAGLKVQIFRQAGEGEFALGSVLEKPEDVLLQGETGTVVDGFVELPGPVVDLEMKIFRQVDDERENLHGHQRPPQPGVRHPRWLLWQPRCGSLAFLTTCQPCRSRRAREMEMEMKKKKKRSPFFSFFSFFRSPFLFLSLATMSFLGL